jgi:hypothetical protein
MMQRSADALFSHVFPHHVLGSWPAPTSGDPFGFAENIRKPGNPYPPSSPCQP